MNSTEKQKRFDFVQDFQLLSQQYGYTPDEAMSLLGFKPKDKDDLLLEQAGGLYPEGTEFIPIGKKRERISSGKIDVLCDRAYVWIGTKMFLVYDPTTNEWAEVINNK